MLELLLGIGIGAVGVSVVWFFVWRNNKEKMMIVANGVEKALKTGDLPTDAELVLKEIWSDFLSKFKK